MSAVVLWCRHSAAWPAAVCDGWSHSRLGSSKPSSTRRR